MDERRSIAKVRLTRPPTGPRWQHRLTLVCVLLAGGLFSLMLIAAQLSPPPTPEAHQPTPPPTHPAPEPRGSTDRLYLASTVYGAEDRPISGQVTVLDAHTRQRIYQLDQGPAAAQALDIALSPDGLWLYVVDSATISAYRASDGRQRWRTPITNVLTYNGSTLDQFGQAFGNNQMINHVRYNASGPPTLTVAPDGRTIYVLSTDQPSTLPGMRLWLQVVDTLSGRIAEQPIDLPRIDGRGSLAIAPDSQTLYYASPGGTLTIIDALSLKQQIEGPGWNAQAILVSPDGSIVYGLDPQTHLNLFDLARGEISLSIAVGRADMSVHSPILRTADSQRLVIHQLRHVSSAEGWTSELVVFDPVAPREIARIPAGMLLQGAIGALSSDGTQVYMVRDPGPGGDSTVIIYNLRASQPPVALLRPAEDIRRLLISPAAIPTVAATPLPASPPISPTSLLGWVGMATDDGQDIIAVDSAGGQTTVARNVQAVLPRSPAKPLLVIERSTTSVSFFDPVLQTTIAISLSHPSALNPWNFALSPGWNEVAIKTVDLAGSGGQPGLERIMLANLVTGASRSLLAASDQPLVNASVINQWGAGGLYLTSFAHNQTTVWRIDPADPAPEPEVVFRSALAAKIIAINADRGLIAYVVTTPQGQELHLLNLQTNQDTLLIPANPEDSSYAAIAPDGSKVAFVQHQRMLLYDVATGTPQVLAQDVVPLIDPIWSADSRLLLQSAMYPALPRDPHLLVFEAATGALTQRISQPSAVVAATPGPAGQMVCLTYDSAYATISLYQDGQIVKDSAILPAGMHRPELVYVPWR